MTKRAKSLPILGVNIAKSRKTLYKSRSDLGISLSHLGNSEREIGIFLKEIHKWEREIGISLEEIGISLAHLCRKLLPFGLESKR